MIHDEVFLEIMPHQKGKQFWWFFGNIYFLKEIISKNNNFVNIKQYHQIKYKHLF